MLSQSDFETEKDFVSTFAREILFVELTESVMPCDIKQEFCGKCVRPFSRLFWAAYMISET